jgi:hypothetical protein
MALRYVISQLVSYCRAIPVWLYVTTYGKIKLSWAEAGLGEECNGRVQLERLALRNHRGGKDVVGNLSTVV